MNLGAREMAESIISTCCMIKSAYLSLFPGTLLKRKERINSSLSSPACLFLLQSLSCLHLRIALQAMMAPRYTKKSLDPCADTQHMGYEKSNRSNICCHLTEQLLWASLYALIFISLPEAFHEQGTHSPSLQRRKPRRKEAKK